MIDLMPQFEQGQRLTADDMNRLKDGVQEVQTIQGDEFIQVVRGTHGLTIRLNLSALLPRVPKG